MPKIVAKAELEAVLKAVTRHPQGAGIEELESVFPQMPRRTLQRRLSELTRAERLDAVGQGRARRYRVAAKPPDRVVRPQGAADAIGTPAIQSYIPLSSGGERVRALVQRPLAARTPVGYNRAFVDGYIPNVTVYLQEPVRQRLHDLGAYFSDRGRWFQRDRGRRFTVIVDGRGCAQATGFIVTQSSMMV